MEFYIITFSDGTTAEEFGSSVQDVESFCERCLSYRGPVVSIEQAES